MLETKFNKIIWTFNGVAFSVFLLWGLFEGANELIPKVSGLFKEDFDKGIIVGSAAEKAHEIDTEIQHVMYESPERIGN